MDSRRGSKVGDIIIIHYLSLLFITIIDKRCTYKEIFQKHMRQKSLYVHAPSDLFASHS